MATDRDISMVIKARDETRAAFASAEGNLKKLRASASRPFTLPTEGLGVTGPLNGLMSRYGATLLPVAAVLAFDRAVTAAGTTINNQVIGSLYAANGQLDEAAKKSLELAQSMQRIPVLKHLVDPIAVAELEQTVADFQRLRQMEAQTLPAIRRQALEARAFGLNQFDAQIQAAEEARRMANAAAAEMDSTARKYDRRMSLSDVVNVAATSTPWNYEQNVRNIADQGAQARQFAVEADAARTAAEESFARSVERIEEARRLNIAAQRDAVELARIAAGADEAERQRRELAVRQEAELRQAGRIGSDVDRGLLAQRQAYQRQALEREIADRVQQEQQRTAEQQRAAAERQQSEQQRIADGNLALWADAERARVALIEDANERTRQLRQLDAMEAMRAAEQAGLNVDLVRQRLEAQWAAQDRQQRPTPGGPPRGVELVESRFLTRAGSSADYSRNIAQATQQTAQATAAIDAKAAEFVAVLREIAQSQGRNLVVSM